MASVFNPTASATISAPPEKVFALLLDRTTWPRWNTFIPRADVVSTDSSSSAPAATNSDDRNLQLGQTLKFTVQARVFGSLRTVPGGSMEVVNILSAPDDGGERGVWRVGWAQSEKMMPGWMMRTQRVNEVVADEAGGCIYRTYMTFDGPMAYVVKWVTGWLIQDGLVMWAEGLKAEAEKES
ncbi:Polyketide cyclase/dehydrase [Macrophomina phaseolina MS6]|uniref:Polyketide cyclase/dehydrase n=1 Tax=Macrophomina phaseolina (strain MS6) TaxID=1126212 RepID=K2RUP6_MACPH|nr:Polyketide cyclase/dehydrase [Macrophomina phaseolina MS6]